MRLTVFGASGGTGRRLLEQARGAGHNVTAVTRRPESIPPRPGLSVVGADVADADAVDATIAGSEAVLSALGVSYSRKPISVYSQGTSNIIAAMHRHGVKRLVVVSSAPLTRPIERATRSSPGCSNRCSCGGREGRPTTTCAGWSRWCEPAIWTGRSSVPAGCSTLRQ